MHVLFIIYCTKLEIEIKQAMFIMRQAVLSMYIVFISFNNVYKQQKYACMCRLNPHDGKEFPHNTSTGIVDRVPVLGLLLS